MAGSGARGSAKAADGPADTRMMAIVHRALRRDLDRLRDVLERQPRPEGAQRLGIAAHAQRLMHFLHGHHTGEDAGLWPLVRSRNAAAAELLDSLEEDHRRIAPAMEGFVAAAKAYARSSDDQARAALVQALDALAAVLYPHLDREVDEAMPVVAATITAREWETWSRAYNVKTKSMRELGVEGHWLIDGLDPEGREIVTRVVPAIPRFVLLTAFRGTYRRQTESWWAPLPGAATVVGA